MLQQRRRLQSASRAWRRASHLILRRDSNAKPPLLPAKYQLREALTHQRQADPPPAENRERAEQQWPSSNQETRDWCRVSFSNWHRHLHRTSSFSSSQWRNLRNSLLIHLKKIDLQCRGSISTILQSTISPQHDLPHHPPLHRTAPPPTHSQPHTS